MFITMSFLCDFVKRKRSFLISWKKDAIDLA